MNIYVIIAIGNKSIQDDRHLVPMERLAPEWLCVANHCTIEKDAPDPSMHYLLMKNCLQIMNK